MDIYHHLENTKVYLKLSNSANIYELDILADGASFSQTFTETTYATKTLHSQGSLVKEGTIKKGNPASFSFSIPLLKENDFKVPVFDALVSLTNNTLTSFTLWFIESTKVFTIENCIFTSGSFNIGKGTILSLSLEGEGTKIVAADNNGVEIISDIISFANVGAEAPTFTAANLQARSATRTFLPLSKVISQRSSAETITSNEYLQVANSQENLISANIEIQNNISWTKNRTIAGGISTTSRETVEYPLSFSLQERIVSGNSKWAVPTAAASEAANNFSNASSSGGANQHFYENSAWTTAAFGNISSADYGILFKATSGVNVTTRVSPGPFYTMDMDWRLASNASSISSLLTYITA